MPKPEKSDLLKAADSAGATVRLLRQAAKRAEEEAAAELAAMEAEAAPYRERGREALGALDALRAEIAPKLAEIVGLPWRALIEAQPRMAHRTVHVEGRARELAGNLRGAIRTVRVAVERPFTTADLRGSQRRAVAEVRRPLEHAEDWAPSLRKQFDAVVEAVETLQADIAAAKPVRIVADVEQPTRPSRVQQFADSHNPGFQHKEGR